MSDSWFPVEPRAHRDLSAVEAKRQQLRAAHVAPLTGLAEAIAREREADVPWFDPASAGTAARVLLLLESPGPASAGSSRGSGFISVDNNDQTAANCFALMAEAGLSRSVTLNWNIVPWYLHKVRRPAVDELREARPYLGRLLDLLPELRVVVLLGKAANSGWSEADPGRHVKVLTASHPSPQNLNTNPRNRDALRATLVEAASAAS